ncbi:hypothetical protein D3C87_257630 [compost metagenome]
MDRPSKSKKNLYRDSDRHLIAEQPGMAVFATGLIIAFFFGYTAKSLLSPQRVSARIEKAAGHIHKDVKVQFGSAQFMLSDGILPRFSVVITDVKMESDQPCWYAPQLEMDELRLPLSLWAVVIGKSPVQSLVAGNVQLTLRAEAKDCQQKKVSTEENFKEKKPSAALVTLSPLEQSEKYANAVRSLSIKKLGILHERYPQYATEFVSFNVNVRSFEPKVIEIRAKTHLLRDAQVGDYLSHANLYIEYKDSPEAVVQSHFFGNWREGHYSVIANYTINDRMLTMEADLRHIPLSQVLRLLGKYDLVSPELNSKQAWISGKTRLVGDVDQLKASPFEVSGFHVEGDLGEMMIDRISFSSLDPLRYSPIRMDVKKLDIEKLLEFLNRPGKSKVLGQLGTFSGQAEIISDKDISLSGDHTGLEFIFSNRGQRELQVIDRMRGEVQLKDNTWNFKVGRMEPRGGKLLGNVKLKADRDFKEVEVAANIDEVVFAGPVQKLMTNGGRIGPMSLNANLELAGGEVRDLKGLFRLQDFDTEGMSFEKVRAQISGVKRELIFNMQVDKIGLESASPGATLLSPLSATSGAAMEIQKITGQFKTQDFRTMEWKNVQGLMNNKTRIITDGSWDKDGQVKGSVLLRDGKLLRNFGIEGSREKPVIVPEPPKKSKK